MTCPNISSMAIMEHSYSSTQFPLFSSEIGMMSPRMKFLMGCSLSHSKGTQRNGITHFPQPLYTLYITCSENYVVLYFFMTIKHFIKKI